MLISSYMKTIWDTKLLNFILGYYQQSTLNPMEWEGIFIEDGKTLGLGNKEGCRKSSSEKMQRHPNPLAHESLRKREVSLKDTEDNVYLIPSRAQPG